MPNKDFDFTNLPNECKDSSIKNSDFKLVDSKNRSHEQKFQTRPTTFFKDSLKRFAKNKSSVVAAVILGILIGMSIIEPLVDKYPVFTDNASRMVYLEPKLFDTGTGFWDGTKNYEMIPTYIPETEEGTMDTNKENWWPNPRRFKRDGVSNKTFTDLIYTDDQSEYGRNGFIEIYYSYLTDADEIISYRTIPLSDNVELTDTIYLSRFDTYNTEKLIALEGNKEGVEFPENFSIGKMEVYFCYTDPSDAKKTVEIKILEPQETFNIGSSVQSLKEDKFNILTKVNEVLQSENRTETSFSNAYFDFRLVNEGERKNTCALIRGIEFDVIYAKNSSIKEELECKNFVDATQNLLKPYKIDNMVNPACWECTGGMKIHMSQVVYCSFNYDSYYAVFGTMPYYTFPETKLKEYKRNGWLTYDYYTEIDQVTGEMVAVGTYKVLSDKCPVKNFISVSCSEDGSTIFYNVECCYYQFYGYDEMPKFLMGTDKDGNHMFRYVFEGLRTSLLLGFVTFIVCFIFGLIWGSVSGYFGGFVDLAMERFTDILSGVPWIVVMTLVILKYGSNLFTFALALCLTGWIGTAATTRTQFYRFRSREYVLASRTLGASDARLIAKHILPNAMGTIITSSVLMIPSIIFSEATISYLGLGLTGQSSLGVILSRNQSELTSNPYLLIFPSIVIALLMISFNLFGNGLRDAVNPSLKGEGE